MADKTKTFDDTMDEVLSGSAAARAKARLDEAVAGVDEDSVEIVDTDDEAAEHAEGDPDALPGDGPAANELPKWAREAIPEDLKIPQGAEVMVVRVREVWMHKKKTGDRVIVVWNLTEADEKLAMKRVVDSKRVVDEFAKQMVRAVNGQRVDWRDSKSISNPTRLYTDIGGKGRQILKLTYSQRHALSSVETIDFFSSCVAVGSPAG